MHLTVLASCLVAALPVASQASNFLRSGLVAESDVQNMLRKELRASADTNSILDELGPLFASLPKNAEGKLSHQAVRYALHRFFVRRHGWFIRGLEPNNDTWHGAADPDSHNSSAMKEWVPSYLQDILEMKLGHDGTDLYQLTALAAALQDLVRKETKGRIETAFNMYEHSSHELLSQKTVDNLILTYFVVVLNAGDFEAGDAMEAMRNTEDFIKDYTGWNMALEWLQEMKSKHLVPREEDQYDFRSVEHLANKIQEEYYSLNERDCNDLKDTLRQMQGNRPGRVRLSTFYNKSMCSHWNFSEKKDYLRSLGVLDETDAEHPSVIIANYAMSRPNCLDSSNLFTICCKNQCEDLMGKLESAVGGASAEPAVLAKLVAALPSATVESPRQIPQNLVDRLGEIAAKNTGLVPLHGRLFAQWMHHAYPLECPYPHEAGAINPLTRGEWMEETGSESERASKEEMLEHIASDTCAVGDGAKDCDETTELPWSDNEEHWGLESAPVLPRRSCAPVTAILACVLAVAGLFVALRQRAQHHVSRPAALLAVAVVAAYAIGLLDGILLFFVLIIGSIVTIANRSTVKVHMKDVMESKECV